MTFEAEVLSTKAVSGKQAVARCVRIVIRLRWAKKPRALHATGSAASVAI